LFSAERPENKRLQLLEQTIFLLYPKTMENISIYGDIQSLKIILPKWIVWSDFPSQEIRPRKKIFSAISAPLR
jgi:hypothetical protein